VSGQDVAAKMTPMNTTVQNVQDDAGAGFATPSGAGAYTGELLTSILSAEGTVGRG